MNQVVTTVVTNTQDIVLVCNLVLISTIALTFVGLSVEIAKSWKEARSF